MQGVLINKQEIICENTGGVYRDYIQLKLVVNQYWNTYTGEATVSVDVYGTYLGGIGDEYGDYGSVGIGDMSMPININGVTGSYTTSGGSTILYLDRWDKIHTFDLTDRNIDFSSNKINIVWSIRSNEVVSSYNDTINIIKGPLYTFSDEDKQALRDSTAAVRCKLIVKETDTLSEIVLTDGFNMKDNEFGAIKDWVYTDERYVPQQGFIGQFVARTLSGNLQNITDDFNIENREIELQFGVVHIGSRFTFVTTESGMRLMTEKGEYIILSDIGEDQTNWYSLGNFIVTNPEDNEVSDNTKFESMDYTKLFNKEFDKNFTNDIFVESFNNKVHLDENDTWVGEVSALWLAQYTCAQVGIEFGQEYFTNSDFTITSNPFQAGETCRDVMKEIAKLAFSWVRIDWDNKCYIDFGEGVSTFSTDRYNIIDNNQYYSLETKKEMYGPINRVYVGMSNVDGESLIVAEDEESIATHGERAIYIYDNPLTNTEELRQLLYENGSANKLLGLTYNQLTTETVGHPWLKGNENITIVDMESVNRSTYAFNRTINYSGHIKTTLDSMGETQVEETLGYKSEILNDIINAKINVDKATGDINLLSTRTSVIEEGMGNYYTKEETDKVVINATTGLTNIYTSAGGNNRFRNTGLYFPEGDGFEYWTGVCKRISDVNAVSQTAMLLQNNDFEQLVTGLPNNTYTVSFYYEKLSSVATASVIINSVEYILGDNEQFTQPIEINTNALDLIFRCDTNNGYKIYDLMCNVGETALIWSQHPDEIATDTVNISKGITITSTTTNATFKANADGIRIVNKSNNTTTEFTETGMITNEGIIAGNASVTGVSFKKVGNQTWLTGE